ncbi:hypothetical protein [Arthrobacter sp. NEB 688]|uniref:hypothetical protein n=1 Tax=Arthrobacter sp. NEB 688 TaxID=904039 RepID=UPI0015666B63|nr:hypothetical protein [Arthrobacter sp. NEB 688]QKE83357.1 hypothetical protein HL663_04950 [Arthrobacter sp. NEB 688]
MTASPAPAAPTGPALAGAAASRRHRRAAAAALLTVATFVVPAGVVALRGFAGESSLRSAVVSAFVDADLSAPVEDSAALSALTATWREFHLVKAAMAGLLVLVLVGLVSSSRRRAEAADPGRRRWLLRATHAGAVVWLLGALTLLLANLQGAAAPFASVTSFLPAGRSGGAGGLAAVLGDLRAAVEVGPAASVGGVGGALLADFARYHAVFAVLAALVGVALIVPAARAVLGRWRLRGTGRSTPTWLLRAGLYGGAAAALLLLAAANVSTWVRPVPALVVSLGG